MTIPLFKVFMSDDASKQVSKVLESGYITEGKYVEDFEEQLRNYFEHQYVLTLNSATSGLTLAIRLLKMPNPEISWPGIDTGDVIISTALTCTATNWPILANGLDIQWADVDPRTCCIDFSDIRRKLSPKTKIIMVVHWGGTPIDLDELVKIQDEAYHKFGFRPYVIEDCAHAFGATFNGKKLGRHGNLCIYSLQAIKHLTTGDGGLLLVPDQKLYNRGKLLRWYGIDRNKRNYKGQDFRLEHDVVEWGYKFHMNNINATIGIANLQHINKIIETCIDNGNFYEKELSGLRRVTQLQQPPKSQSSYWLYTMLVDDKLDFMEFMKEKQIMVSQVHQRNDYHTCVRNYITDLPNLDEIEEHIICIPVGWWITHENREYIVKCIKEWDLI